MLKKGIWTLLALVLVFVVYDFVSGLNEEQQVREIASMPVQEEFQEESIGPELTEPDSQTQEAEEDDGEYMESSMVFGVRPGNSAYEFELEDMDGNLVRLSDYRGKKVFLNFWASWCPPCRVEMPHLQEFHEENDEVVVLGVNVTSSESDPANAVNFLNELNLTFPNLYGTDDLFTLYMVESLPTSYFIGSDGVVYERVVGPVTKDILEARFALIE